MQLRTNLQPGDIGYVVSMHGILYAREYGLDRTFEAYVASGLGEFVEAFDERKDCLWLAEAEGNILGSIVIVGLPDQTAQLRWFLVHPEARGQGVGHKLLSAALAFCRERAFRSVFLLIANELQTAARLYQQAGFTRTEQQAKVIWGGLHTEERYDPHSEALILCQSKVLS